MSYITISKDNFFWNVNQIAVRTQSLEKIAIVLKDNAYGHDLNLMASLAQEAGIRHAVVRDMAEAERVATLFESVLVLSDIPKTKPLSRIHIAVNELAQIDKIPAGTSVELKFDTGMHRQGLAISQAENALEKVLRRGLNLKGIMTHYRNADEVGSDFFWQRKRFDRLRNRLERKNLGSLRWHSCNSAALFRLGSFDEDLARVGIAAYGCLRMHPSFKKNHLKPVMALWGERIASRAVEPSYKIGYGGEGKVKKASIVSTYDIGYGDGWPRGDARNPYPLPRGGKLVGRVSMDMCSAEGDEELLCLFDDASYAARHFGTIAYDIMVKLNARIPRIIV